MNIKHEVNVKITNGKNCKLKVFKMKLSNK